MTDDLENGEWETVQEESPSSVIFDTIGDEFIGTYRGLEHIEPSDDPDDSFDRYVFRGTDGELYSMNTSYSLKSAMEKGDVKPGDTVRIRYKKDIPTSRNLNPLKDFEVAVKRAGK